MRAVAEPASLYADEMARWRLMGVQSAREGFRKCVDDALEQGIYTLVARHGRPVVMMVSAEWGMRAAQALGEPINLAEIEPDAPASKPPAK